MNDLDYMSVALGLASKAEAANEVPVGALIVLGDEIVGQGWNQPIGSCDPSAHAEIVALRDAALRAKNYRLPGTTLYVTIEPCPMCVGAMIHARVKRLVYGAPEPRTGAIESVFSLAEKGALNHNMEITRGILADKCAEKMRAFFAARRYPGCFTSSRDRYNNGRASGHSEHQALIQPDI